VSGLHMIVSAVRIRQLMLLILLCVAVGLACGFAAVAFLWLLTKATAFREAHDAIVFLLPLAGLVLGNATYRRWSSPSGGTNGIIHSLASAGATHSPLVAPLALLGTIVTHLFGGSAGREGTAVQVGASISELIALKFRLDATSRRHLVLAGVAGGFGAVFGTPLSGAVFAMELMTVGVVDLTVAVPTLTAAYVGDHTARTLGAEHSVFPVVSGITLTPLAIAKWVVFAAAIALLVAGFITVAGAVKRLLTRTVSNPSLRTCLGGLAVVVMWKVLDTTEPLGLGLPLISRSLDNEQIPFSVTVLKLFFTATTVGSGFVGGETTPLFCMGATLGNTLSTALSLPARLAAAVGLASAFGAAAKTPLTVSIMAVELFGAEVFPHVALVATVSAAMSAPWRLYAAQGEAGASF
jgi:H+/Cl- antiporter ClcA